MRLLDSPRAIYCIVGLGLLIRLIPLILVGGKFLAHENPSYDAMAWQLIHGSKFSPYWPPGLPYYLAFFHVIFGPGMLVARASMLAIYTAFSLLLYALVKDLSSRRAANLAVLAFALYPSYVRYAFNPSTEYPTAFCLLGIAYMTILLTRAPHWWHAAALGLVLGALALVRPNSLGLALIVPACLVFKTRKWGAAVTSVAVSSILVGAWLWKAHELAAHFVLFNDSNEENFVFANHPDTPLHVSCRDCPQEWRVPASFLRLEHEIDYKPTPERQRVLRDATIHYVFSRPDLFLVRIVNRLRAYFTFPVHYADPFRRSKMGAFMRGWLGGVITIAELCFFWPIMILAIVFCFNLPNFAKAREPAIAMLGIAAVYAVPCWLTWSQARYAFPVIPFFAVFALVLLDALFEKPWREVLRPVLVSTPRRTTLLLTLAFFAYIQIEWIALLVSSNTWRQPIQRATDVYYLSGGL